MTPAERIARAAMLDEWRRHFADAIRFGADSIHAGEIADVLTFGSVRGRA